MTSPKHILLLDTGNEWGGGTNSMFELLKRLDRERFAVTCCFYKDYRKGKDGRLLSEELADIGIPLIILPTSKQPLWAKLAKEVARGLFSWSVRLKKRAVQGIDMQWRIKPRVATLRHHLDVGGFDLLYMNNQPSSNLEGYLAGEAADLPVVQHARIDVVLASHEINIANRVAKWIICNSYGLQESLQKQGVLADKIVVVHNGIAIERPQHSYPVDIEHLRGRFVIGTVGSLVARKCIDHLLVALERLVNKQKIDAHLIIVGEGPEQVRLERLATKLGVKRAVSFVGFSSDPLVWIGVMDVFVFASKQEGFGRVLIEAMLCSKPVVAADVVGPNEVVLHEGTGFLYPHGDIDALVADVTQLYLSPELRLVMGEAGYQRVVEHFSIDAYVAGVTKVLTEAGQ